MESTKRFKDLEEVAKYRETLRDQRASAVAGVRSHWSTLGEPGFRSGVLNGTMRSVVKAWKPLDTLKAMAGEPTDLTGAVLGLALGSRSRTVWGRLLVWAVGAAAPMLVGRLKQNEQVGNLLSELERSWHRVIDRLRERREARRERSA
jgi:hypothetical protein